jgi:nucleotide-binding universal stress UspA family protein
VKEKETMTPDTSNAAGHEGKPGRIVVGIDGSPASLDALAWAGREASLTTASLEIVMTWDWPASYGWALPYPSDFDPSESTQAAVTEAATGLRAKQPDIEISTRVEEGHPAPVLVEASKGASLLVVGSRGHGEFVGMLIGSVSEFCATNAHCPVLNHRGTD